MHNFALIKIRNIMQTQFTKLSDSQWQFITKYLPVQRKRHLNLGQINIMGRILSLSKKKTIGQISDRDVFTCRIIGSFHYKGS